MKIIQKFKKIVFTVVLLSSSYGIYGQGPNAPEASGFEAVDATDMVSLTTGDMVYVMPIMNVPSSQGGYPLALSYHGGIGYDQEASWVGLGWNLNPGAINRAVNGYPDDWKGAEIVDREYFNSWGENISLSVGYGRFDVALGYAWDSNGGKKGSIGIGVGVSKKGSKAIGRIGVGISYSNKDGLNGSVSASLSGRKNGFGVGIYADTNGVIGISASHSWSSYSRGDNVALSGSSIGISLVSNKGKVGVGLSGGGSSVLSNNGGSQSTSSIGYGIGFYLYGVNVSLGYDKSTYTRFKHDKDYVYGPLYYSEVTKNNNQIADATNSHISYPGTFSNEHSRDIFMDAYEQKIPELASGIVGYNNVFENQKNSFNAPSYDGYEVNAQGLSGRMSPRLLENGLIINRGIDIEYDEDLIDSNVCAWGHCSHVDGVPTSPLMCASFEGRGNKMRSKKIYVNNHFSTNTAHKFSKTFGKTGSTLNFYFDYQFPSNLQIHSSNLDSHNGSFNLENYFSNNQSVITERKENSSFIETFTNEQAVQAINQGHFLEAKDYNRINDEGYRSHGIGGYKVTTVDGRTYHYSRPVYHYEEIYRQLVPKDDNGDGVADGIHSEYGAAKDSFYREVRKTEPYATHWLLTAVTGPDYIKNSDLSYPSEGDYGYWVRFDYGEWSGGYTWRIPFTGYNNLSVDLATISKEYSWGRKELVYLDKIVTNTHTALFVKSIREDNIGRGIGNEGYPSNEGDQNVSYLSQKTLKLDEIILLTNKQYNNSIQSNTQASSITNGPTNHTVSWHSIDDVNYSLNQQNNVIDNGDFTINPSTNKYHIYDKAEKVIKLNHNYSLANKSPNSTAGRLTLESVETLGRNGKEAVPPYSFEYINNVNYTISNDAIGSKKDDWGYYKDDSSLWSLNKVNTPTGASIKFDYEEDEYYTEAFSRRLWTENLKFRVIWNWNDLNNSFIEVTNSPYSGDVIDFLDYFTKEEKAHFSTWMWYDSHGSEADRKDGGIFVKEGLDVISITSNKLTLRLGTNQFSKHGYHPADIDGAWSRVGWVNTGWYYGGWKTYRSQPYQHDTNGSERDHQLWYTLLANKVPGTGTGGGIRVAKISTVDEVGNDFSTEYNYNHPTKNRTSGITSFAPSKGKKYVAYRREIPSPRVMYEYVTMTEKGSNNTPLGKTQYQFNTLKPVVNIFDPNMQAGEHFRATTSVSSLDAQKGTIGVDVKLEDNFATLGSVLNILQINSGGHLMSQNINHYLTLDQLSSGAIEKPGYLQESFHSMKSVYDYHYNYMIGQGGTNIINFQAMCDIDENIFLYKRIANSSQKKTYPLVQKKTEEIVGNKKFITEYSNIDPKTGGFLRVKSQLADGTYIRTDQVPAYTKYPQMGSKVDNINNKHMLTQEAMSITSWSQYGNTSGWKTLNANITTWNDTWTYRDHMGNETAENGVWRKHKSFVWKDDINPEHGTYITNVRENADFFNWGTGEPTNEKWNNVSEITRYTHWSSPLENKDINGNYISSKMAENDTKVIVGGNAGYTEMYASGAEYDIDGYWLDQEIAGAQLRDNTIAHTGKYSLKIKPNDKGFNTILKPGEHAEDRYKISVWANINNPRVLTIMRININGVSKPFNGEVVYAGNWAQINHYEYLDNASQNIYITVNSKIKGISANVDDFRIHPVYSGMNTYVYDTVTDELNYILDANNMATKYVYDDAGRLCKLYKEVEADLPETDGGFKLINQYKYNYKNGSSNDCNCCDDHNVKQAYKTSK